MIKLCKLCGGRALTWEGYDGAKKYSCIHCNNASSSEMKGYSDAYCIALYKSFKRFKQQTAYATGRQRELAFSSRHKLSLSAVRTLVYRGGVLSIMKEKQGDVCYTEDGVKSEKEEK